MTEVELAAADVWATGISPDSYPTQFLRADLDALGVVPAVGCSTCRHPGAGGRGGDASAASGDRAGVTFMNIEDETGMVNVLCTQGVWARNRKLAQTAPALLIRGRAERRGAVTVVAERMRRISMKVGSRSRD
jgi:error-prone DNA polymerase